MKTKKLTVDEWIEKLTIDESEEVLKMNGFEHCIVGLAEMGSSKFFIYDKNKVISELIGEDMSEQDAIEYYEFNILGGYVGSSTPAFIISFAPKQ